VTEKLNGAGGKILGAIVLGFLLPTMYILGSASSGNAKAAEYDRQDIVSIERKIDRTWDAHDSEHRELTKQLGEIQGKLDLLIRLEKND
jgi:hypothetical protein